MKRLTARDEKVLSYPPEAVYAVLSDFQSYALWWPTHRSVRVISPVPVHVGMALRLATHPFVRWTATITELHEPDLIRLSYTDGCVHGDAAWRVAPDHGGARVSYEIDIEAVATWLRLVSVILDVRQVHSRQIHRIFAALERRLDHLMTGRG